MEQYYIDLEELCVGYTGHPVISGISSGIKKGEIVTLIGPNGGGKSTIIKSLIRQLKLIGGKVYYESKDMMDLAPDEMAKLIAVVLTDRIKPELMTCYDIVASGRYPYTGRLGLLTSTDRNVIENSLKAVNALDIAGKDFARISDGQRQRILLARAICQESDIIILDEPTSYLDIRHKVELLSILKKLSREQKKTVIMSLHEIDLAMKVSDRILCVREGEAPVFGTPDEIFNENTLNRLYGLEKGIYDPAFGSIEMPKAEGRPRVFVISSGGSGIPVYRKLQKENIPFAAGILYRNDIDYHLAKRLASRIVEAAPFTILNDSHVREAKEIIKGCEKVINAGVVIGECNRALEELIR